MAAFSSDSLTILAVSDVRTSLGKVNRLGEWLVKNGRTPDAVVVCGDLGALSPADRLVPELAVGSEGELSAVLCGLESIVCRVLYVPGVSDPPSVHAAPGAARVRLTTHSTNLHGACFALASDLACTGLSCLVDVEVATPSTAGAAFTGFGLGRRTGCVACRRTRSAVGIKRVEAAETLGGPAGCSAGTAVAAGPIMGSTGATWVCWESCGVKGEVDDMEG